MRRKIVELCSRGRLGFLGALLLVAGMAAATSSGCSESSVAATASRSSGLPGDWVAGTEKLELTRTDGPSLPVQVWFPAQLEPEQPKIPYRYDEVFAGEALSGLTPDCSQPRPVVLFSHGSGSIRWQSPYLAERLATRGYLVVAPDHVSNTVLDNGTASTAQVALRRPKDIIDAFDWIAEQSLAPEALLSRCVEPSAGYAVVGYSFGGYTAFRVGGAPLFRDEVREWCAAGSEVACEVDDLWNLTWGEAEQSDAGDPRVWAVLTLAPWNAEILGRGLSLIDVPVTVLAANLDTKTPPDTIVRPMFDQLMARPRTLGVIADAAHASFVGVCALVPAAEGCGEGFRDPAEVNEAVATTAVAFLDRHRTAGPDQPSWPPDLVGIEWETLE